MSTFRIVLALALMGCGGVVAHARTWIHVGHLIDGASDEVQTAKTLVIEEGKIAFSETGRIPFWKLSLAADLLGIEPKDYEKHDRDSDSDSD